MIRASWYDVGVRHLFVLASLVICFGARAEMPAGAGVAPTLAWGEHQLALQGGWPVQAASIAWGTSLGWNNGAYASLDLRGTQVGAGMWFCRPFAHGVRTSWFFHFGGGALLQHPASGPVRFGGEGRVGINLGVGLGRRKRVTLELGTSPAFRFGPGIVETRPVLGIHAAPGITGHLSPEVAVSLRGRVGVASVAGEPPGFDWAASLAFQRVF